MQNTNAERKRIENDSKNKRKKKEEKFNPRATGRSDSQAEGKALEMCIDRRFDLPSQLE
jgi:hypothetical protein